MIERAVVFGSNSFSGSHLVARLLDDGVTVLGISRSEEPPRAFRPYDGAVDRSPGRFRFLRADLNADLASVARAIDELRPTHAFNFAAQSMVAQSWESPADWYRTNVLGVVRLAELLMRVESLTSLVHVTTPEVYGSTDGLIRENWSFSPSTPYAASRAAGDWHLRLLAESGRLPVAFTRAANVYGPGQQLYRIIPRALLAVRTGSRIPLHGGGSSRRSFIHISDVVDGTLRVATSAVPGESYHLSTERVVSIRELVGTIADLVGVAIDDIVEAAPERPGKDEAYLLDSSRARTHLDWSDTIDLEDGLSETLAWVDAELETLRALPTEYRHRP